MIRRFGGLLLALSTPALVQAQAALVVAPAPTGTVMRAGTAVPIRLLTGLTTEGKHVRAGDRFDIEVADAVTMNGQTVIPVGSHGVGEVTSVRNKGMWGKSGNIEARLLYIRVGDRQIRITGTFNDKGVTGTGAVVGALVLIPVAGFFMTGTSARIPAGSTVTAFLDEDVPVQLATGTVAQAPLMAVPTTTPAQPAVIPTAAPAAMPSVTPVAMTTVAAAPAAKAPH